MWVWAVSESEGIKELISRNKQNISGFQDSCNPTIKLIFPEQGSSSLLSLAEEQRIREISMLQNYSLKPGLKSEMSFSPSLYTCTEDEIIMMSGLFQIPKWISGTTCQISGTWVELSHSLTGLLQLTCKLFFLLSSPQLLYSCSMHCDRLTFFIFLYCNIQALIVITVRSVHEAQIPKTPRKTSNHCISLFPNQQISLATSAFRGLKVASLLMHVYCKNYKTVY